MFAGSSPLTRGTRIDSGQNDRFNRFIPAYAGNSAQGKARNLLRSVHPRLRGELAVVTAQRIVKSGSSPLTRGTQFFRRSVCVIDRFIPAYAGNSNDHFRPLRNFEVHPRLRGELEDFTVTKSGCRGSSPLTRGTRTNHQLRMHPQRFIPAYAGNSSGLATFTWVLPVHPRLRGELRILRAKVTPSVGSSPLTRGTHLKWLQHYTNRLTAKLLKNISKQEQSY